MQLNLTNIEYTYPGASDTALHDVAATFAPGWTGLIGDNGAGKTTLALISAGKIMPDAGNVYPSLFSSYCLQDSSIAPDSLNDFASDWSGEAIEVRRLLQIDERWLWEYDTLSGGQKKRIQIACALWQHPDLLIMDEPTNDLDATSRKIVEEALRSFTGIGLLISHDRALLDGLVTQCLVFESGTTTMRQGNYSKVFEQMKQEAASQAHKHDQARREAARIREEARRREEEAARSKSRLSARGVSKKDSDRRERIGRAKVSGKDSIAGRASATMARKAERATARETSLTVAKRYDASIFTLGSASQAKSVVHSEECELIRDDFTLHVPSLWVGPRDHVGISGKNGSGKSSLLEHLLKSLPPSVHCAHIPQEVNQAQRVQALERLRSMSSSDAGKVLALVARLNSDPDRLLDGDDISPGELRKLILAEQLLHETNLIVADEPTNHLDIASIEALQSMLSEFPGAILLVTHDSQLLENTCNIHWCAHELENGTFELETA